MPQMMPMKWLMIMILSMFMLMMFMIMIFYFYEMKLMCNSKFKYYTMKKNYKWLW